MLIFSRPMFIKHEGRINYMKNKSWVDPLVEPIGEKWGVCEGVPVLLRHCKEVEKKEPSKEFIRELLDLEDDTFKKLKELAEKYQESYETVAKAFLMHAVIDADIEFK